MLRVDAPEILDTDACSAADVAISMQDLGRVNRWFGGVATTRKMVERVTQVTGEKRFSLLEVAAGTGEVPDTVQRTLVSRGINLDVTLLDRARSHLPAGNHSVVGDAMRLPFGDGSFDLISCNLFTHHLDAVNLCRFVNEALRVCRRAVLINDLVRHPMHLALVYVSRPIMRSRIAWLDGVTSVRRAYVPEEICRMIASACPSDGIQIEIARKYLFRMGVIVWKVHQRSGQSS
jgi:ubiquinone/menaquinone biosynthesis C-methylase UbiE